MSHATTAFREAAPAKINLYLHVLGLRPDGLHLIDSLVVFAGVGDVVTVSPGADISLTRAGPTAGDLPPPKDDLVFRAAHRLAEMAGVTAGVAIHVEKNLPVASGIGGGSADAAAAIRALAQMWRVELDPDQRSSLAQTLGADVAVCLQSQPSQVGGTGELVSSPGALPSLHAVLVNPRVAVPTADVFAAYDADPDKPVAVPDTADGWSGDANEFIRQLADRRNDLTVAAQSLCPAIGDVLARLDALPGCLLARMCGSGATCFGLFASSATARDAADALRHDHPDWWIVATRFGPEPS